MKTMKMNKEINKNRVGIYAQKSAEITAVGDGLASKEAKSPVIEIKDLKTDKRIERKEINVSEKDTLKIKQEQEIQEEEEEEEEEEKQRDQGKYIDITSDVEEVMSNHTSETCFVRGVECDMSDEENKLQTFPSSEEYYGKEKWDKALEILQKLGYVNWEINTMLTALDRNRKVPKRKSIEKEPPQNDMKKKAHLDDDLKPEEENLQAGTISGILLKERYLTFDLRANIGDASHPNFHILPENKNKFYLEFYKFLREEECFQDDPVVCSFFVNETLMIECRNAQILEQIDKNICKLDNRPWPGAEFVMIPRSCERKNIQIYIPYPHSVLSGILEIIKEQNRLPVEKWKVNSCEKWEDGICLDVEVDGGTYLRLIQDQDDIFFLMKKAMIKLPAKDKSKDSLRGRIKDAK